MKRKSKMVIVLAVAVAALQIPAMLHLEDTEVHGYSVEKTLSKPISDSKTSSSDSFAATLDYTDPDGYKGTLSKNGSSFVKSGEYIPGHTHDASCKIRVPSENYLPRGEYRTYYKDVIYRLEIETSGHGGAGSSVACKINVKDPLNYFEILLDWTPDLTMWHLDNWSIGVNNGDAPFSDDKQIVYLKCIQTVSATGQYSHWGYGQIYCLGGNSVTCTIPEKETVDTRVYQQNYSGTATKTIVEYPALVSLEVLQMSDKVKYQEGTDFDPAGMVVEATYADGHQEIIEMEDIP